MKDDWFQAIADYLAMMLAFLIIAWIGPAEAQQGPGPYIGRDGRAHPQVIVSASGAIFPVIPVPCYGSICPLVLAAPLPWRHRAFIPPMAALPPPPPPPIAAPAATPRARTAGPPPSISPVPAAPSARPAGRGLRASPPPKPEGAPFTRDKEDALDP